MGCADGGAPGVPVEVDGGPAAATGMLGGMLEDGVLTAVAGRLGGG